MSFKPGTLLWFKRNKKYWPCRVAKEKEAEPGLKQKGHVLIWVFAVANFQSVSKDDVVEWDEDKDRKMKNDDSQRFKTALKQAEKWEKGPKVYKEHVESTSTKKKSLKRKLEDTESSEPPKKKQKKDKPDKSEKEPKKKSNEKQQKETVVDPDFRFRVMRNLGLWPPEGSPFQEAKHKKYEMSSPKKAPKQDDEEKEEEEPQQDNNELDNERPNQTQ
eukprot:TRINITY_DN4745_c0_g1_i2.p1 TRINITY_DN4745_c0_g1~~TRINITY_DN4745_c0_g1_i2.p1  ORF type:complete len:217 (-),score=63.53 TRINITY_DN4745_c0_g1_i2:209-859(-)